LWSCAATPFFRYVVCRPRFRLGRPRRFFGRMASGKVNQKAGDVAQTPRPLFGAKLL